MIQAIIDVNGFTVRGHSDFAEYGKDIVCSAVSALTQTIAIVMEKKCNAFVVNDENILFVSYDEYNDNEKLLTSTLIEGLTNIRNDFPEHLEFCIKKGVVK